MNMSSLIFSWLLSVGIVVPMEEYNDGRELYILYIVEHESEEVLAYEHAYKEEIMEWIQTGDFEYDKDLTMEDLLEMGEGRAGMLGALQGEIITKD